METNPYANSPIIKNGTIILKTQNGYLIIHIGQIAFCKADGNYSKIIFEDGSEVLVTKTLLVLQRYFKKFNFIRCHNSYLINIKKVKEYDRNKKILTVLGHEIPVSRRKCCKVLSKLKSKNDQL
ncbi:MAG: LytTR family transcriptional regulator DNA-binding domain-containing protein [Bacteroidia bacterium]|nr:LytTR family transcriptional regulator DNA-binding domain-containing protein [Bacteroidia bacterium]